MSYLKRRGSPLYGEGKKRYAPPRFKATKAVCAKCDTWWDSCSGEMLCWELENLGWVRVGSGYHCPTCDTPASVRYSLHWLRNR